MTIYALRSLAEKSFQIAKLSDDFNVEATYDLVPNGRGYLCTCPAGARAIKLKPCKHQRMLPLLMGAVNLPRFYNPDTGQWKMLAEVAPGMKLEHEEGERVVEEQLGIAQTTEPHNPTATQVFENTKATFNGPEAQGVQRSAEAMIEPIINKVVELTKKLDAPIRRRV